MPVATDPQIAAATVRLKNSQTRLTTLRRKCLEETFIERKRHDEIVQTLLTHMRTQALGFAPMLRRALGDADLPRELVFKVEDIAEATMDSWMLAVSKMEIPWPPSLTKPRGIYTTRPGPKKGSTRKLKVNGAALTEVAP